MISILDNIKLHSHTAVCMSFLFKIFHSIFVFQSFVPATCICIGDIHVPSTCCSDRFY